MDIGRDGEADGDLVVGSEGDVEIVMAVDIGIVIGVDPKVVSSDGGALGRVSRVLAVGDIKGVEPCGEGVLGWIDDIGRTVTIMKARVARAACNLADRIGGIILGTSSGLRS